MSCSLGIDIGTTTIKVCIVRNFDVLESFSASHNAQVVTSHLFNEQNPEIILGVVDHCLTQLQLIKEVDKICVTGQMHGVLMWEKKDCLEIIENPTLLTLFRNYIYANTNLITWQDQRCGKAFLESLSCSSLSTGFGLASLLWLQNEAPNIFNLYNSCGTIMDFVVCLLTLKKKPSMSVHNANSWGYFDLVENRWNFDELKRDSFNCSILPDIVPVGTAIGNLYHPVYGMSRSSIVYVALGDHQCSFRACSAAPTEAVLNIGTSSQLSILVPNNQDSMGSILEVKMNSPGISITPYDKDFVLITAASLNGGNVFEQFISTILSWCRTIGCSNIPSNQELMEKLLSSENLLCGEDPLIIIPTLYGERHAPNVHASILNVSSSNLSLASITQSLFEGLSTNLCKMLPKNYLVKYGITQIAGTGRCFIESSRFRDAISRDFDIPWRLVDKSRDASLGAVLFSIDREN